MNQKTFDGMLKMFSDNLLLFTLMKLPAYRFTDAHKADAHLMLLYAKEKTLKT